MNNLYNVGLNSTHTFHPALKRSNTMGHDLAINFTTNWSKIPMMYENDVKIFESRFKTLPKTTNKTSSPQTITGQQAKTDMLMFKNLSNPILHKIWTLSDHDQDGQLSEEEYILAMILCKHANNFKSLPESIPKNYWKNWEERKNPKTEFHKNFEKGIKIGSPGSRRRSSNSFGSLGGFGPNGAGSSPKSPVSLSFWPEGASSSANGLQGQTAASHHVNDHRVPYVNPTQIKREIDHLKLKLNDTKNKIQNTQAKNDHLQKQLNLKLSNQNTFNQDLKNLQNTYHDSKNEKDRINLEIEKLKIRLDESLNKEGQVEKDFKVFYEEWAVFDYESRRVNSELFQKNIEEEAMDVEIQKVLSKSRYADYRHSSITKEKAKWEGKLKNEKDEVLRLKEILKNLEHVESEEKEIQASKMSPRISHLSTASSNPFIDYVQEQEDIEVNVESDENTAGDIFTMNLETAVVEKQEKDLKTRNSPKMTKKSTFSLDGNLDLSSVEKELPSRDQFQISEINFKNEVQKATDAFNESLKLNVEDNFDSDSSKSGEIEMDVPLEIREFGNNNPFL